MAVQCLFHLLIIACRPLQQIGIELVTVHLYVLLIDALPRQGRNVMRRLSQREQGDAHIAAGAGTEILDQQRLYRFQRRQAYRVASAGQLYPALKLSDPALSEDHVLDLSLIGQLLSVGLLHADVSTLLGEGLQRYAAEPLIRILDEAPWVSRIAGRHGVEIGGFTLAPGGKRLVVVATLDNLLKGAATQAMQNLNQAFGFDELDSIPQETKA